MHLGYQSAANLADKIVVGPKPDDVFYFNKSGDYVTHPSRSGGSSSGEFNQNVTNLLKLYNQQRLANENLDRQRRGLTPLSPSDIPSVDFGLPNVSDNTRNLLFVVAALGIGAFLILNNKPHQSAQYEEA